MPPEQVKERPNIGEKPLAQEAALLFSQLLSEKGVRLQDHSAQLIELGERLLPHAKDFNAPIHRDAFIQPGPGVVVTDVLGWICKGEFRSEDGTIKVRVEKTDRFSGKGVALTLLLEQERNGLSLWASNGWMNSGEVEIVFWKNGKKDQKERFVRQPYIFHKSPLKPA